MALSWNNKETITTVWKSVGGTITKTYGHSSNGMTLIDSSMGVGDFIAFGKTYSCQTTYNYYRGCHKIQGLEFNLSQALVATGYTYVWEYYDYYNGWVALSGVSDGTNGLQNAGTNSVTWTIPIPWRIGYKVFNGDYWSSGVLVRIRITGVSSITQDAVQDSATDIQDYSWAVWINDGNTYTPLDIYNYMVSIGMSSLVTKSDDDSNIMLNANLILDDGTLHIYDHTRFTVGKTPGQSGEWFSFEITNNTNNPTLQLGHIDSNGQGYRGGELVWNNGWCRGNYLYWYGRVLCYGSRIWMYGYNYVGLTNYGYIEIVDSIWTRGKASSTDRWYFASGSSGFVRRSSIQNYFFYVYSGDWSFDTLSLPPGESGSAYGILAGAAGHTVKVNNKDFGGTLKAEVTQRACIALIDCENFDGSQVIRAGTYDNTESITKRFTFKIKVVDEAGNPIQGAKVTVKDQYGRTALKQDLYAQEDCYVVNLDKDVTDTSGYLYHRPAQLDENDLVWVRGEIMRVSGLPAVGASAYCTFTRMEDGSTVLGLHSYQDVYKIVEYETTDANGEVKYSGTAGDMYYWIVTDDWWRVSAVNGEEHYNPFTIRIEKEGYQPVEVINEIDDTVNWVITLKKAKISVDQEVLLAA